MSIEKLSKFSGTIIQFYEKMFSWESEVAKNTGLSPQQNHTIDTVGHEGSIRMKPLAEKLGITTGTLTVMVDRLQKAGFMIRQKDPGDGRAFNIVLTEKGKEIHHDHTAYHLKLAEDITGHLGEENSDQFIQLLDKINRIM